MTIRFLIDNYVDKGIVAASPVMETNLPVENIQLTSRSKVARSTSAASQQITGTFAGAKTVNAVVLARHNFVVGMTFRVQLYSDVGLTTQVYDSTTINLTSSNVQSELWSWGNFNWGLEPWGGDKLRDRLDATPIFAHYCPSDQSNIRGFRITIANSTGDISYFELGRLFIGKYIQPTIGISKGHGLTWNEDTKQYRSDGGTLRSDKSLPYRQFEFDISVIDESDRIELQHQLRNVGMRDDFFISIFPGDATLDKEFDYSAVVKLARVPKYLEITQGYYKTKFLMEEV